MTIRLIRDADRKLVRSLAESAIRRIETAATAPHREREHHLAAAVGLCRAVVDTTFDMLNPVGEGDDDATS